MTTTPPPKRRATSPAALALRLARAASSDADLADALIPESAASRLRIRSTAAVTDAEEEAGDLLSSMMEVVIVLFTYSHPTLCRGGLDPPWRACGLCTKTWIGVKGGLIMGASPKVVLTIKIRI